MNETLAQLAYSTALRLALPAYLARLWWRGRAEPGYRRHWSERLGAGAGTARPGRLWLHAVSLGETLATAPLVAALREREPGISLLLTHGTATGREAGARLLREGDQQAWLPYDTPGAARRFLARHRPTIGVLMETEVWPNLLHAAAEAGLPLVLANARLSARSAAKGERLAALMRPALGCITEVLAQTEEDAARLRAAGALRVQVMGNLKFDLDPRPELLARGRRWRAALQGRPVVLAAVTREGEEGPLLQAWAPARMPPGAQPLLVVVPRHPQRFDEVASGIAAAGMTLARRSAFAGDAPPAEAVHADVWLGDSLGEMAAYYALADVALLGGSFAPLGGQNLIEAAACGCPLLMGPHTFNFADAAERALAAGAAERLPDLRAAVTRGLGLLHDPARTHMAEAGSAFAARHRGAASRMAAAILQQRRPAGR